MNIEEFLFELEKLNIKLTEKQLQQLEDYYLLLIEWNNKINLTRITEKKDVYLKHFYDSLTITKVIDMNKEYLLCDVGTGAGFPGVVLKIVFPKLKVTLLDSLNKRIDFLNHVIQKLELEHITTVHARMEEYSRKNREKFDLITSRAVARTEVLLEICVSSLKVGGHLILLKGMCEEEIKNSQKKLGTMDCKIGNIEKFNLPYENSNRTIIDVVKTDVTNSKYPRSIDKIKKSL